MKLYVDDFFGAIKVGNEGFYDKEKQSEGPEEEAPDILGEEDDSDFSPMGNTIESDDSEDFNPPPGEEADYLPPDDSPDIIDLTDFDVSKAFDEKNTLDLSTKDSNN